MSVRTIIISGLLFLLGAVMGGQEALGQKIRVENPRFQRKALVAPDCMVNTLVDAVSVLEGETGLNNMLDEDLSNATAFKALADVKLFEDVLVRVKDRKHIYPAGTMAGFCVQSKSEGGLLSLDVLKIVNIGFYLNGELKKTVVVKESSEENKLLGLQLIQFGGNEAATTVSAEAPCEFDEIGLFYGGVNLSVINSVKVRYGFVGDQVETKLINLEGGPNWVSLSEDDGLVNPEKFIDSDITNHATQVSVLITPPVNLAVQWAKEKEFPAGSEVGIVYFNADILSVPLGETYLEVTNARNETRRINLDPSLLKVVLLSFGRVRLSIISPIPFCKVKFHQPGGVGLGGGEYYYAYVNEAPIVEERCDLGLSMDATICETETQYQLTAKEPVTWTITKQPDADKTVEVNKETGAVTNMALNVTGKYIFTATSKEDPDCQDSVILQRGMPDTNDDCNQPITGEEYELYQPGGIEGGILTWDKLKNPDNILDGSMDTYAEYIDPITLLTGKSIFGVQNKTNLISDGSKSKRVGFVLEVPATFLNLGLLKTFQIRVKNNQTEEIYSALVDRTNLLSADLIGGQQSYKMRYSIEVPASKGAFDCIELWAVGVLELKLSNLRIYGVFVEDVNTYCDDPLGCDAFMVGSSMIPNPSINYDGTKLTGLANVGAFLKDLENLLDDNLETYAFADGVLSAAGVYSVSVRFGKVMSKTHQVGWIIDSQTFLADISLINVVKMEVLRNGITVGNPKYNWDVLGADVIGYGDKTLLMMNPNTEYDEVRLTVGNGVSVLNGMKIYGAFIRNDADGDGIPDCSDPESCGSNLTNVMATDHICLADKSILVTGDVIGLLEGESKTYRLTYSGGDISKTETVSFGEGKVKWEFGPFTNPGRFTLYIDEIIEEGTGMIGYDRVAEYSFDVHPNKATWKKNPISTNWNEWNNWEEGSPWTCTNVIIPTGADLYPILTDKEMNGCNLIHFEPNSEVVKTHYLTYTKAWVEMNLSPDRYYMLSAPLKEMYSGDMFISQESVYPNYFTDLTDGNYAENRTYPTIYQRLWETTALDRPLNGNNPLPVYPEKTRWTKPYNHLATLFGLQNDNSFLSAFSLRVDPEGPDTKAGDEDTYLFRFPKLHKTYNYVNEKGETIEGKEESISRIPDNIGRFIYENPGNEGNPFPLKVRLKNNDFNNKTYLMGNPFMAHISIAEFLKINTHISSVKVYDGNINNSVVADIDDGLVSNTTGLDVIAPMQSVFIVQKDNAGVSQYCEVTFTEEMLVSKPDGKLKSNVEEKVSDRIVLTADVEGKSSTALVRLSDFASDEVVEGEDSEILLENEVSPAVALFVENEGKALDIEQRANLDKINLGFCMSHPAAVNLQVSLPVSVGDKVLEDLVNNRIYLLKAGETTSLILPEMDSQVGRFRIVDESMVKQKESVISIQYLRKSGLLEVRSFSNLLERCDVYTIDGRLVSQKSGLAECYQLDVPNGMLVVRAITENGDEKVMKLRVAN